MKRLLVVAALALAAVLPGTTAARSDTYCVSSGVEIFGEPWVSHEQCVDCPIGPDCPQPPGIDAYGIRVH